MFPSASDGARKAGDLPTTVSLHDMNHGTIDMGGSPEASHNFPMVPIQSFSSSLYGVPLWDRRKSQNKPELITVDLFGKRAATRSAKGNGLKPDGFDGGKGETLFDISSWGAFYADEHNQTQPIQGLPMHWVWTPEGCTAKMNLLLLSFMYDEHISTLVDLLIDIPLSLSLDYHAQMYFMRGPNRHLKKKIFKKCQDMSSRYLTSNSSP